MCVCVCVCVCGPVCVWVRACVCLTSQNSHTCLPKIAPWLHILNTSFSPSLSLSLSLSLLPTPTHTHAHKHTWVHMGTLMLGPFLKHKTGTHQHQGAHMTTNTHPRTPYSHTPSHPHTHKHTQRTHILLQAQKHSHNLPNHLVTLVEKGAGLGGV